MHPQNRFLFTLTLIATILAFCVIILGAYTRLSDAGLGCPDWPTCYGHLTVPDTHAEIQKAEQIYPGTPVEQHKAWTEMTHRYFAGILGLFIFAILIFAWSKRQITESQPLLAPLILVFLVIFQAILGKWTVTDKLFPPVVMGHLLGGMLILGLLWWTTLRLAQCSDLAASHLSSWKCWAIIGMILIFLQIMLGGWVSANYAALGCPYALSCFGPGVKMTWDWHSAFNVYTHLGHRTGAGLATIQIVHRIGAIVVFIYVGILSICLMVSRKTRPLKFLGLLILLLLILQVLLGLFTVVMNRPLPVAIAHNGVAALLFISIITLVHSLFQKRETI